LDLILAARQAFVVSVTESSLIGGGTKNGFIENVIKASPEGY
jgi:hypothetical protein